MPKFTRKSYADRQADVWGYVTAPIYQRGMNPYHAYITVTELCEITGLSRARARFILNAMAERGFLVRAWYRNGTPHGVHRWYIAEALIKNIWPGAKDGFSGGGQ